MNRRAASVVLVMLFTLVGLSNLYGSAAADDPTAGPSIRGLNQPATISIDSISPSTLPKNGTLTVQITVTNTSKSTITSPRVRLQSDDPITSRYQLFAVDKNQPSYTSGFGPFTKLPGDLGPGQSMQATATATTDQLQMYVAGAYPVLINVNGDTDSATIRAAQAAITVPYQPVAPGAKTTIAWLWPLIDTPHRLGSATQFLNNDLAAQIARGGRLDRLLATAENFGSQNSMTLLIDPELISELQVMVSGYSYLDKGKTVPGPDGAAAQAWLARLKTLAKTLPIATTPMANVDINAVTRAGLGNLFSRARATGDAVVKDALGVNPIDLDMPAGGYLTSDAVSTEKSAGISRVVLAGGAFGQADYLESPDGVTQSPNTVASGALSGLSVLAADPALTRILGAGSTYIAGPIAGDQRFVAELGVISAQEPNAGRAVLAVPPPMWNPAGNFLSGLFGTITAIPWLASTPVGGLFAEPAVDRGSLQYPASAGAAEVSGQGLQELKTPLTELDQLASAFSDANAKAILAPYYESAFRIASASWPPGTVATSNRVASLSMDISSLRGAIKLVPPSNGTYTLSSATAPLVFTVENQLDVPVKVKISLDASRSAGITANDTTVQQIAPHARATIKVATRVQRSGTFSVVAQIQTPEGQPLGESVKISVRSSAYGQVALVVTAVAFGLLLLMIGRRYIQRVKNIRRQREHDERMARDRAQSLDESVPFGDHLQSWDEDGGIQGLPIHEEPTRTATRDGPTAPGER
ncbi:MAG: DUF6049 family protein [Antricoccus sp.]